MAMNCGLSINILLAKNVVGSPSSYPSSRCSFLATAKSCDAQTRLLASGLLSTRRKSSDLFTVRADRPDGAGESPETVDISVFRFTLGIPGFDDSDLPGVLGILFGGLIVLNHAFSLTSITSAQLRSEGVGLVLAALAVSLPFVGRQLNGTKTIQKQVEPGLKQIFCLADGLTDVQRQDLAWASYNLMRNTSTTAMLVWHSGRVVSARGFWIAPTESGPGTSEPLGWLQQKLDTKLDYFSNLKEPLYLSANAGAQGWDIILRAAASLLVQPFPKDSKLDKDGAAPGFLLLISNTAGGYRKKDRYWTASLAKKLSDVLSQ